MFQGGCEPFVEKHRLQIHPYADYLVTQQKGRKQLIVEPRSNGPGTYALNYDPVEFNMQMVGDNEIKVDFSTTDGEYYIYFRK